jgi:hypothetical protein
MVTIVEKNFTEIIRELTNIVNDFPEYKLICNNGGFGNVADYLTVQREKSKPPEPPKKKHTFFAPGFELAPIDLFHEKPIDKFDIHLHDNSFNDEKRLDATLRLSPNYNKTLVKAISDFLEKSNFKVTWEINS